MATFRIGTRRDLLACALFPVAALLLAAACSEGTPSGPHSEGVGATSARLGSDGGDSLDASDDGPFVSDGGDAGDSGTPAPARTARWVRSDGVAPHRSDPGGASRGTRQFIVFGGRIPSPDAPTVMTDTDETLIYRDGSWHRAYVGTAPSARSGSAMVATGPYEIVLFGGASHLADGTTSTLGDTWRFGRYNDYWEKLSPAVSPSPRAHARTVYDPQRNRTILFGGDGAPNADGGAPSVLRDTWTWNDTTWTALPIAEPTLGVSTSITFDEEQGVVVLATVTRETSTMRLHVSDLTDGGWVERGTGFDIAGYDGRILFDRSRRALAFVLSGSSTIYVRTATGWLQDHVSTSARVSSTSPAGIFDYDGTFASLPDDEWEAVDGLYGLRAGTTSLLGYVHPGPRRGHALSSVSSYYVLLFGGTRLYGNNGGALLDDTWEYRDGVWSQWRPTVSPSAREDHAMAYDDGRMGVYLFGGQSCAPNGTCLYLDDMWFWQAGIWTNIPKSGLWPAARGNHGMAYDSVRHRLVMAGGYLDSLSDYITWEWDGSRWTQSTVGSPYPYGKVTLAFDSKRNQTIAVAEGEPYRGFYNPMKAPVVCYAWDGTRWYDLATVDDAVPLAQPAAAYDPGRNRLVVTSGSVVQYSSQFPQPVMSTRQEGYELGAGGWVKLDDPAPPARYEAKLAYYGQRNASVLYGGRDFNARTSFQDTWELVATPQAQGASCQGTSECASGYCVDGVCCNTDCSYYAADRCNACSIAAGGQVDGVCAPKALGSVCHASTTWCSATGVCGGNAAYPSCEINDHEKDNQSCHGGTCYAGQCRASGDGGVTDGGAPDDGGDASSDASVDGGVDASTDASPNGLTDASDAAEPVDAGRDGAANTADAARTPDANVTDAGGTQAPSDYDACACRAAPRRSPSTPAGGLALAGLAVVVARRRTRRTPRRGDA